MGIINHKPQFAMRMFRANFKNQVICYKLFPMNSSQADQPTDPPQLLVVDDDTGIRDLLSRYLTEQGFRVAAVAAAEFIFGPYRFSPQRLSLYRQDQEINLSRAEYELLDVFVRHPGRVLSRDFTMERLGVIKTAILLTAASTSG